MTWAENERFMRAWVPRNTGGSTAPASTTGEPMVGERLVNGEYQRLELHTADNGDVWSRSEVLGLDFYYHVDEEGLRRVPSARQRHG